MALWISANIPSYEPPYAFTDLFFWMTNILLYREETNRQRTYNAGLHVSHVSTFSRTWCTKDLISFWCVPTLSGLPENKSRRLCDIKFEKSGWFENTNEKWIRSTGIQLEKPLNLDWMRPIVTDPFHFERHDSINH